MATIKQNNFYPSKMQLSKTPLSKTHLNKRTIIFFGDAFARALLPVALTSLLLIQSANAMPNGDEIFKYFNPIHEKSYLNEKQDRIIKKKSFKSQDIQGMEPITNRDIGLFASLPDDKIQDSVYINHLLNNQEVGGIACLIPWRMLEPEEEVFNWKIIDDLISHCAHHNKQLILRVSSCGMDLPAEIYADQGNPSKFASVAKSANPAKSANSDKLERTETGAVLPRSDTPAWVFDAGTKFITYTAKDNTKHTMPIFWDGTYLAKWSNFVNELGRRYDKNQHFQSIGITGGGILGGTPVIPDFSKKDSKDKNGQDNLASNAGKDSQNNENNKIGKDGANPEDKPEFVLKRDYSMTPVQLVSHWKYVADVFPKAFPTQHLNFDLDPPIAGRQGQDRLDEIADYLIYRYGERVYVTRQNVKNEKHGFDEYRLLLKFKNDTLSGCQLTADIASGTSKPLLAKITKNALDDGLTFAEVPAQFFDSNDKAIKDWLAQMRLHLGYQLILQEIVLPTSAEAGKTMPFHFAFLNTGAAPPMRPDREMDKDIPSSYKLQLEFKDNQGKTKALLRRTPGTPTTSWVGPKPIIGDLDLKTPPLKPGKYDIYLALIDDKNNHKLNYCQALPGKTKQIGDDLLIGQLEISAAK